MDASIEADPQTLPVERLEPTPNPVEGSRPVSYRSFKHLLGETSLERKCRFIFGLGILVLVSASFFWYGQKTESLVRKQTTQTARMLVGPTLMNIHYKALGNYRLRAGPQGAGRRPQAARRPAQPRRLGARPRQAHRRQEAAARRLRAVDTRQVHQVRRRPARPGAFAGEVAHLRRRHADLGRRQVIITPEKREYQYIQAVFFKPTCLMDCHGKRTATAASTTSTTTCPSSAPTASTGSRPRRATWPAPWSSTCRWSRPPRRSTATAPC